MKTISVHDLENDMVVCFDYISMGNISAKIKIGNVESFVFVDFGYKVPTIWEATCNFMSLKELVIFTRESICKASLSGIIPDFYVVSSSNDFCKMECMNVDPDKLNLKKIIF